MNEHPVGYVYDQLCTANFNSKYDALPATSAARDFKQPHVNVLH